MNRWDAKPVIITVAPVGAEVTRADNPALPHTPAEVVSASLDAVAAGASIVHLHAREPDGTPSAEPALFREMIDGIRAGSGALTMCSTGGSVTMTMAERTACLQARPDLCSLETGSLNFGDEVFATARPDSIAAASYAGSLGVAVELELFDVGHSVAAARMLAEGHLAGPLRCNLVLGVPGGIDASVEAIQALLRPLPSDIIWSVTAIGRQQRRMLAMAVLMGADGIRVGFEDGVKLPGNRLAPSNAALVEDAAELVRSLGRGVASCAQARERYCLATS